MKKLTIQQQVIKDLTHPIKEDIIYKLIKDIMIEVDKKNNDVSKNYTFAIDFTRNVQEHFETEHNNNLNHIQNLNNIISQKTNCIDVLEKRTTQLNDSIDKLCSRSSKLEREVKELNETIDKKDFLIQELKTMIKES